MADINIQKKDNKPVWPWVLGVLVVLGLAVWLYSDAPETGAGDRLATQTRIEAERAEGTENNLAGSDAGRGMSPEEEAEAGAGSSAMVGPVADFVAFVKENDSRGEMGLDHEYTSNGLRKLGDALNSLVDSHQANMDINQMRNKFNQKADQLQNDPQALKHANIISEAFTSAADVIGRLQQQYYPELSNQASEVRQAAQAIDPQEQTLNQRTKVKSFFDKSSDALEAMVSQKGNNQSARR